MDSSIFQPLLNWIVENPNLSGFVVFCIAAIESLVVIGILVPGVAFMMGIGTLVGLDVLPLWSTLFWAAAGAIFGDGLGYWLGRHFDKQLRNLWPLTRYPDLIPKGEKFFKRHGGKSVLLGRFVGPIRSIIPAVAGMMHMSPGYFYFINIVSAIAWAPVVILPGVAFGASLNMASEVALRFALLIFLVLFIAWFFAWSIKKLFSRQLGVLYRRLILIIHTLYRSKPVAVMTAGLFVVCSSVGVIIFSVYMDEKQPVDYQVSTQTWWDGGWKKIPFNVNEASNAFVLNTQWQANLKDIKKTLLDSGWVVAERMSVKNAMRWLTPTPALGELPVASKKFNTDVENLLLIKVNEDNKTALLLRLWSLNSVKPRENIDASHAVDKKLWVGSLTILQLNEWPLDFYTPTEVDGTESLTALITDITVSPGLFEIRSNRSPDMGGDDLELILINQT